MSELQSDSFSSGQAVSDTDLETINNEELVIFDSTQSFYSNKTDIIALYKFGNAFENTIKDWVGLFKKGWQTVYDFSAYQWAPFDPLSIWQQHKRRTIFPHADIQDLYGHFQFIYVTGDNHVIGVSNSFQVGGFAPGPAYYGHDDLEPSMSLISLESLSSWSDETESIDLVPVTSTAKDVKGCNAASEIIADPLQDIVSSPEPSPTPKVDNWTLSDFAVGNKRSVREKICFVPPCDSKELMDEYEPLKQFYISLRKSESNLVEEIPTERHTTAAKRSISSDLPVREKLGDQSSAVALPTSSFLLSPSRDGFLESCLQLYRRNLLESTLQNSLNVFPDTVLPRPRLESFPIQVLPPSQCKEKTASENSGTELSTFSNSRTLTDSLSVFPFKAKEPEEHDEEASADQHSPSTDNPLVPSDVTRKQTLSKSARDLRKKRFIRRSKIKQNRSRHDAMLQEALTLLGKSSSSTDSVAKTPDTVVTIPLNDASPERTDNMRTATPSRKRHNHSGTSSSKAKRRCLTSKSSPVPLPGPVNTEDEGYRSMDEEDKGNVFVCPAETLEVLNLALTEALKNNEKLRSQIRQAGDNGCTCKQKKTVNPVNSVLSEATTSVSAKPTTANKTVNTKNPKKCTTASNTSKTVKKDSQNQCKQVMTRRKATNTEKNEKRHVASNTAVITKQDTHSQCSVATTAGKSINTEFPPSKKDAENNTLVVPKSDSAAQCVKNKPDTVKPNLSDAITLDLTIDSALQAVSRVRDLEDHSASWRTVSSKKTNRLRRIIAKKREEFARVRENAENYERKTHILEASLQSVRQNLSTETIKRLQTEKELKELRAKFWELLASRKSQPWSTNRAKDSAVTTYFEPKPVSLTPLPLAVADSCKTPEPKETIPELPALDARVETVQIETPCYIEEEQSVSVKTTSSVATDVSTNDSTESSDTAETASKQDVESDKQEQVPSENLAKPAETQSFANAFQFHGVPVKATEVKKATCGSISIKKFLMPAMTAIAETFSSTKSKSKPTITEENDIKTSTGASKSPNAGAFASVTVSVSARAGPTAVTSKTQKMVTKNKKTKATNSGSNQKQRTVPDVCKVPCQETQPRGPSSITLDQQSPAIPVTFRMSDPEEKKLASPEDIHINKAKKPETESNSAEDIELESGGEPQTKEVFPAKKNDSTMEERPLDAPVEVCAESDDVITSVTTNAAQSVKIHFTQPKAAGKGRAVSYTDTTADKFTRNHFARAVRDRDEKQKSDVTVASPIALPDVVQSCTQAFSPSLSTSPFSFLLKPTNSVPAIAAAPVVTNQPQPQSMLALTRGTAVRGDRKQKQHHQQQAEGTERRHHHQQQQQPRLRSSISPRALYCDYVKAYSDAVGRQLRQGMCLTCGMKFSPSVDRYLVEEHIYFHHAFTE